MNTPKHKQDKTENAPKQADQQKKTDQTKAWSASQKAGASGAAGSSAVESAGGAASSKKDTPSPAKDISQKQASDSLKQIGKAGTAVFDAVTGAAKDAVLPAVDVIKKGLTIEKPIDSKAAETGAKLVGIAIGQAIKTVLQGNDTHKKGLERGSTQKKKVEQTQKWAESGKDKTAAPDGKPEAAKGKESSGAIKFLLGEKFPGWNDTSKGTMGLEKADKPGTTIDHPWVGENGHLHLSTNEFLGTMAKGAEQPQVKPGKLASDNPWIGQDGQVKIVSTPEFLGEMAKKAEQTQEKTKIGIEALKDKGTARLGDQSLTGEQAKPPEKTEHPEVLWLQDQLDNLKGNRNGKQDRPENLMKVLGEGISQKDADKMAFYDKVDADVEGGENKEAKNNSNDKAKVWAIGIMQSDMIDVIRQTPKATDRAAICAGISAAAFSIARETIQKNGDASNGSRFGRKDFLERMQSPADVSKCIQSINHNTRDELRTNYGVLYGADIARQFFNKVLSSVGKDPEARRQATIYCANSLSSAALKVLGQDAGKDMQVENI
jgi:hypothetical protein